MLREVVRFNTSGGLVTLPSIAETSWERHCLDVFVRLYHHEKHGRLRAIRDPRMPQKLPESSSQCTSIFNVCGRT